MATDYPIEITDPDGSVRIAGLADFTDPDNQPAGTNQPFQPASGDTVVIVENSNGDDVLDYDDDEEKFNLVGDVEVSGNIIAGGAIAGATGQFGAVNSPDVTLLGFFSANPVAQPQVPATPLPQDIVDALVLLGVVSQAS